MLTKVKKFLFYSGLDKESHHMVKSYVSQSNRATVGLVSGCATILIAAMFISTFFVEGVVSNRTVYMSGMILSFVIFLISMLYAREHSWITMPLVYASSFIFYTYGIIIGTVTDPGQKTVTFIVMLVFLPVIFIDNPMRLFAVNAVYIVVFIKLCFRYKTGAILQNDVIDAIAFGVLGLISGIVINRMKIRGYMNECKLQEVSRFDQLTQMNNRNSYELSLEEIPDHAECSLACIYVDVNGLHELNNTKGHDSGDEMLKYVAGCIKTYFGEDLSFRIGGDEFIIFVPDTERKELENRLDKMIRDIEKANYHVATGMEIIKTKYLSMNGLIKSAEIKMYQNKKQFYKDRANDRRNDFD
ncbi:GGDEF domain-containing protein [Candidatus Saccharibacteria bacterium]|nr:GGDEF domain-containing protein [Candidatus Saccharibacteria bacterium]